MYVFLCICMSSSFAKIQNILENATKIGASIPKILPDSQFSSPKPEK